MLGPAGLATSREGGTVWRFTDESSEWRVGLAPSFVSVDTTAYRTRSEFLERLSVVLRALEKTIDPKVVDRFGIRFINRIVGTDLSNLPDLIRSEGIGLASLSYGDHPAEVTQSISVTQFNLDSATLQVRTGVLPANTTTDPGIEPIGERSWLLDMDMFSTASTPFSPDRVLEFGEAFAQQIYRFFRWIATSELLRKSGSN